MTKIRVALVEDEPIIAADLENQLTKSGLDVIGSFESGEEILDFLDDHQPDVILMDIQLFGSLDGVDTAHLINKKMEVPIIFLTSNTDSKTFNRAKLTFPHAFLSKPFRIKDVLHSINLALEDTESDEDNAEELVTAGPMGDRIFIRDRNYLNKVMINDILMIEADGAYSKIITSEKEYVLSQTLKKIEEKITHDSLIRIHRSYIVNLHHVDKLSDGYVHIGDLRIPVSRSFRKELDQLFRTL